VSALRLAGVSRLIVFQFLDTCSRTPLFRYKWLATDEFSYGSEFYELAIPFAQRFQPRRLLNEPCDGPLQGQT
jgi:hypothetical protein